MQSVKESIALEKGVVSVLKKRNSVLDKFKDYNREDTITLNRIFDICLSSIGLMVSFLIFPFIAFGIKLSSQGPVFFKQRRTGKFGNEFICYKFRTMHLVDLKTRDGKPIVTQKGDKRIFWFGKLLRKSNLDELPQIFNVLKGDMRLVGPRPYPIEECKHWNNTFDDFHYRYLVKPGVTGLSQATGYRGGTLDEDHMRKRLDRDLIYVQKQSFLMDMKIILLTIKQMISLKTNAH